MTQQRRQRIITTTTAAAAALLAATATTRVQGLTLPSSSATTTTSTSTSTSTSKSNSNSNSLAQLLHVFLAARGGGNNNNDNDNNNSAEDDELDAYINALVAEVETEEVEVAIEEEPEVVALPEVVEEDDEPIDVEEEEEEEVEHNSSPATAVVAAAAAAATADASNPPSEGPTLNEMITSEHEVQQVEETNCDEVVEHEAAPMSAVDSTEPSPEKSTEDEEKEHSYQGCMIKEQTGSTPTTIPPNALYRFLLSKKRMGGHVIIMVFVWIAEFIEAYLPALANLSTTIMALIFGNHARRRGVYDGTSGGSGKSSKVNDQYAAFVSDNRAMRGKERKQVSKQADVDAADHLQRIGSGARYKHLSQDFMQHHAIGMYAAAVDDNEREVFLEDDDEAMLLQGKKKKKSAAATITTDDDDDEDVDWVVKALMAEEPATVSKHTTSSGPRKKRTKKSATMMTPRVDVGVSNTGVTVGVGFSIGGSLKRKTSKRRKTALIAAATSTPQKTKKISRPAAAGENAGMFGRIRDFGANNLVSRSLMGAYPGDALTPSDAADSNRLLDLAAKKYGYGDWSDDDHEDDDDLSSSISIVKRRKQRRSTNMNSSSTTPRGSSSIVVKKARKRRPKSSSASASVQFDTSSTCAPDPPVTSKQTPSPAKRRSSKMVRLPTERLSEGTKVLDFDLDTDLIKPTGSILPNQETAVPRRKRSNTNRTAGVSKDKILDVIGKSNDAPFAKLPPLKKANTTVPRRKRSSKSKIVRLPTDLLADQGSSGLSKNRNQDD